VYFQAILAAALLITTPAWAINRCTGADGKVSYQEGTCAHDAAAKAITPVAQPRSSQSLNDRINNAAKQCGVAKLPEYPAVGWSEDQFLNCSVVGLSETPKINTTETANGVSKQYVFRYYKTYVYVRRGMVAAVQR